MGNHNVLCQINKLFFLLLLISLFSAIVSGFDPILTSTDAPINSDDADLYVTGLAEEPYKNIIDWRLNDKSIALLNMPFEGNAQDYSTNSYHGTVVGATLAAGYDGHKAYSFDGDDFITTKLPYTSNVDGLSVGGWYKTDDYTTKRMSLIGGNNGGRFEVYVEGGKPGCRVWDTGEKSIFAGNVYNNDWHYVMCVQDYKNKKTLLYVDGFLQKTVNAVSVSAGGYWNIGKAGSTVSSNFKGQIDDVVIINRVLSDEQITNLVASKTYYLSFKETKVNDVWSAAVTVDGVTKISNQLIIQSKTYQPQLTSTDAPVNSDIADLYVTGLAEEPYKNIIDWRLNSKSIALLNMPFEGNAQDYSTNGYHGTVVGAAVTTGYDGHKAYSFDGDDFITTKLPYISNVDGLSVSAWYKTDDYATKRMVLVGGNNGGRFEVYINQGHPGCRVWDTGEKSIFSDKIESSSDWHQVICVQDYKNKKTLLYVDGVLEKTVDAVSVSAGGYWNIGKAGSTVSSNFKGQIDDVVISNRAVSPEQINAFYAGNTKLVSQETKVGDVWKALVSIQDQNKEILSVETNQLEITKSTCMQYDWVTMESPFGSKTIKRMWGASASSIYLLGPDGVIYYDAKKSSSLSHPSNDVPLDLDGISDNEVYTVGKDGILIRYKNTVWEKIETGTGNKLRSVWVNSPTDIFVGPENNNILHYNGFAWEEMDVGSSTIYDLWGSSPKDIYGTRGDGSILRYNGAAWIVNYTVKGYQHFSLQKIWGSSKDDIFVVGSKEINGIDKGMILHYDGKTWKEMNVDVKGELFDVWGTSPENVYVTGKGGVLLHYDGNTWTKITTPISSDLRAIWGSSPNNIYVAGNDGLVLHYTCIKNLNSDDSVPEYSQEINFPSSSTGRLIFSQDDQDAPEAGTYLWIDDANGVYLFNYQLDFFQPVLYATQSEQKLKEDFMGSELVIENRKFTITDAKGIMTGNGLTLNELELMAYTKKEIFDKDEIASIEIDGTNHNVKLLDLNQDSCTFLVDGTELLINKGETRTTNGIRVGVTEIKTSEITGALQCTAFLGATKITLIDNAEVQFNDEGLDGTTVDIDIAPTTASGKWSGFKISWGSENDEIFLAPGDEFEDPIFGGWKLVFGGLVSSGREEISFVGGSTSAEVVFTNEDGQQVTLPLSADADCFEQGPQINSDGTFTLTAPLTYASCNEANAEEVVFLGTNAPTMGNQNVNERLYLQGEMCWGGVSGSGDVINCQDSYFLVITSGREAHLMQVGTIDHDSNQIDLKDITYGTEYNDKDYIENVISTINLGDDIGNIELNVSNVGIFFNSIGSSNGVSIETLQEGFIVLNNTDTHSTRFEGLGFNEYNDGKFSGGDIPSILYLAASELGVSASYDDTDADVIKFSFNRKLSGVGKAGQTSNKGVTGAGFGWYDVSSTNADFTKFMTFKGTLIVYDEKDKKSLLIDHPHDTVHAELFVEGVELGNNNFYYNQSLNEVEQGLDDTDLPSLLMEEAYIDYQGDNWN